MDYRYPLLILMANTRKITAPELKGAFDACARDLAEIHSQFGAGRSVDEAIDAVAARRTDAMTAVYAMVLSLRVRRLLRGRKFDRKSMANACTEASLSALSLMYPRISRSRVDEMFRVALNNLRPRYPVDPPDGFTTMVALTTFLTYRFDGLDELISELSGDEAMHSFRRVLRSGS